MTSDDSPLDRLRPALKDALHALDFGPALPVYLKKALLRYYYAEQERITRELVVPKLVQRAARAGLPKSKKARGPNAFEAVGSRLGLSDSTVERDFRKFPPDPIDELDPNSPKESESD